MEPKKANDPDELGGWRITGRLGEGGFGTVFLAEKGAQKAAIKVIRQEFVEEDDARDRLATEAEILSKLSDPSIGKILDSDLSGVFPWIATEFINGPTLDNKVKYEGPLEEIAWFNLAANIFHAIVSANELGIIHKDVKPSNIILGETGNKLIDFGIAHISGQTRTASFGDREGSIPFSSPEHFAIRANPKMDVFSAAATLAFAGKGESIWKGENELQLMRSINEDSPNLNGLSDNQIKFLAPLLEKNPSDRPSALETHQSALGYIEFLLGNAKKPTPLKGRSKFRKLIHSKVVIAGVALSVIATAAFAASVQNQNLAKDLNNPIPNSKLMPSASAAPTLSASAAPTLSASAAPTLSASRANATGDQKLSSTECQRLTNELKTKEAIEICLVAAKSGDAVAMNALGYNYYVTLKDETQGIEWYKKAADKGSAVAMYNLGTLYIQRNNSVEAEKWFIKCIDSDYAFCAFNYGSLLEKAKRIPEAKVAYQKGVKLGDSGSAQNLGLIYINEQNWSKAREVLLVGANLDNHSAAYSLGQVYARNYSDLENACKWFYRSSELRKDYIPAKQAVIEICKNRKFEIAPDVVLSKGTAAPYQVTQAASDRKVGDWTIWIKNADTDASTLTGIQYRVSGSRDQWQYTFYGTYFNNVGIYSYINERPGLEGACLDFRLVRESKDGYIVQIWELPKSICKNS
jgi:serine/threonine protein kinase